ncbi:MAG: hypothetical protein DRP78_06550, partial [Candidatus Omnitrophota bacterium]
MAFFTLKLYRKQSIRKKNMQIKKIFLFLVLVLSLNGICFGATYYMATDGSDTTGDGSSGNEWLTLQHSMALMSGGDTLIIRDGVYTG